MALLAVAACSGRTPARSDAGGAGTSGAGTSGGAGAGSTADGAAGSVLDGGATDGPIGSLDGATEEGPVACAAGGLKTGDVLVQTLADLQALTGVQCIEGSLTIKNLPEVALTGLDQLRVITGSFTVSSTKLTSLGGLGGLRAVGGGLSVSFNQDLKEVTLPALESVGWLFITINARLGALSAPTLGTVGGALQIGTNDTLTTLDLPSVVTIDGSLDVEANPKLAALTLPSLVTVMGAITIGKQANPPRGNAALTLIALPSLARGQDATSFSSVISLALDPMVTRVDFSSLPEVGRFESSGLGALRTLSLGKLRTVSQLGVVGSPLVEDVRLDSLEHITRSLTFYSGAFLDAHLDSLLDAESLDLRSSAMVTLRVPKVTKVTKLNALLPPSTTSLDFPALTTVGELVITGGSLTDLAGLGALRSVGSLSVADSPALTSLSGLEGVATMASVHLTNLPKLSSVTFPALTEAGAFQIAGCPLVSSLDLPVLATAKSLDISAMDQLTTLNVPALASLSSFKLHEDKVVTSFSLPKVDRLDLLDAENDPQLASFSAPSLTALTTLTLVDNPHLPTCLVAKLRTQLPATSPATMNVTGNDDAATCN